MDGAQDNVIYTFIRVPVPIGTAGAFIWAVASFIQQWDPEVFPDLKTVFAWPGMQWFTAVVLLLLLAFYLYLGVGRIRLAVLRAQIRLAERRNRPPPGMALVPAGAFKFRLRGRRVYLHHFFIDKHPVTNEQYLAFVQETGHAPPASWEDGRYPPHKARFPVADVSWDDARQYCRWRSRKKGLDVTLPTEQEWEKAARGPHGHHYPWGNRFDPGRCNVGAGPQGEANRVDAFPQGISPYGCWDMCGNVWEWTDSWFDEAEQIVVLKGGSFYFDEEFAPVWIRYHDPITDKWPDLGFRCVVRL